jgi:hypothetical protein
MEKGFGETGFVIKAVLVLSTVGVVLCLNGCCPHHTAKHVRCQLKLSRPEYVNAQRMTDNFKIGDCHGIVYVTAGDVHIGDKKGHADIIAATEQDQALIRYIVYQNNQQQLINFMVCAQQDSLLWQIGFGNLCIYAW